MGKVLSTPVFIAAIVLILLAGLIFSGGLYYFLNQDQLQNNIKYTPVSTEPTSFNLQINSPEDNALVFDPNLLIRGKSTTLASVIVTNGDNTIGFDTNSNGDFSKIISLQEGPNILTITAFDKTGASKSLTKQLYYSKDRLEDDEK